MAGRDFLSDKGITVRMVRKKNVTDMSINSLSLYILHIAYMYMTKTLSDPVLQSRVIRHSPIN